MLIISQRDWSAHDPDGLAALVAEASRTYHARAMSDPPPVPLLLLPLSSAVDAAGSLAQFVAAVAPMARAGRLFIAGALRVAGAVPGTSITTGFVIADSGELLSATPKHSPDLLHGFVDGATSPMGAPTAYAACATPLGQVVVLPGEDILFPQLVRAAVFAGGELLLNPTREFNDPLFEARRNARTARAWENHAYVATASAVIGIGAGAATGSAALRVGPPASALVDPLGVEKCGAQGEDLLVADVDIELLRRRRDAIVPVQPLHLRAKLFAEGYRRLAERQPAPAASPRTRIEWLGEARRRLEAQSPPARPAGFIDQYDVILTQTVQRIIQRESDVTAVRLQNIQAALKLAGRLAANPISKLVVFGEFFMHGQGGHGYRSPITLQRLAIRYPGPEMELLQDFALRNRTYVCGSSFEIDDRLPGHVFNSAFVLNDSGELIHRYRKIQCADVWGSLPDTTPSSVYDRYLDLYGYEHLFPVANTPIGRLGTMVCFDQAHPEVARMLTRFGAELIIHPSSEGHGSGRRGWDFARATRAFENTAYVLSAMPGGEHFDPESPDPYTVQMRGYSRLINFDGSVQGVADTAGPCVLKGTIDLKALQRARSDPRANLALWDDPGAYAAAYEADVGLPNNLWGDDPLKNPYVGFGPLKRVLASYYERGIFVRPQQPQSDAVRQARIYSAATAPAEAPRRLADQKQIDGEHIQI
jgi:predicted amidohydrolase